MTKTKNLRSEVIDQMVKEQNEKIKEYERGDGVLQKIADGRIKVKGTLKVPKMKCKFEQNN